MKWIYFREGSLVEVFGEDWGIGGEFFLWEVVYRLRSFFIGKREVNKNFSVWSLVW